MNKYHNKKVEVDGYKFDSRKEARRYRELKLLEHAGVISNHQLQVPFVLFKHSEYGRVVKYIADFTYIEDGKQIVEDVKGFRTDVYKLKKRLMAELLGIVIREV